MHRISIGADHAGYAMKEYLKDQLLSKGYEVTDRGCYSEESIDYPDFAHPVAQDVEANPDVVGIVLCGSGNGINMTVNKHQGIRSALCWKPEIARLAREHNDANILALPARYISFEDAMEMSTIFLNTAFEGGRHERRVKKIPCC